MRATLDIVMKPLAELRPAPYNPRQALAKSDRRYRKLKRSLERFGLVEPLIWNRRTGHVVGGHQRLKILQDLGRTEVPVSVVELEPEQEKALNLVLNNREAQSDWDLPRLRESLEELAASPREALADSGFDPSQLELLRSQLAPAERPAEAEPTPTVCEATLVIPACRYDAVRPKLDALLNEADLECHVRWR